MTYGINDIKQASLGTIVAILFFYLLRAGEPISIDPTKGLMIGLVWLWIVSMPFITRSRETKIHAIGNIIVALVISTIFSLTFDMISSDQIFTFGFFGTSAWLGALLGVPTAQFFDKMNITNLYDRWFIRK